MPEDYLYIYEKPFLVNGDLIGRSDFILPTLSDVDRVDEKRIQQLLMNFAIKQDVIRTDTDGVLSHTLNDDMSSWVWSVQWMNFRSLVDKLQCVKLMQSLQVNDSDPINKLIDLHARLGCLFSSRLLNTLCHRTLSAISLIPYEVPKDHDTLSWGQIHTEQPFLWLLILTQALINCNIR